MHAAETRIGPRDVEGGRDAVRAPADLIVLVLAEQRDRSRLRDRLAAPGGAQGRRHDELLSEQGLAEASVAANEGDRAHRDQPLDQPFALRRIGIGPIGEALQLEMLVFVFGSLMRKEAGRPA